MMRILGRPGGGGGQVGRTPGWSGGSGGLQGVGRLLPSRLFWLVRGWGRVRIFLPRSLWRDWRLWGWGRVALEEGLRSPLARVP